MPKSAPPRKPLRSPEHLGVHRAGAGFGKQVGCDFDPLLVVSGRFVLRGRVRGFVRFVKDEPGGIVLLLHQVEAGDAGLLRALPGTFQRGFLECRNAVGFDVAVHDENLHGAERTKQPGKRKGRRAPLFPARRPGNLFSEAAVQDDPAKGDSQTTRTDWIKRV